MPQAQVKSELPIEPYSREDGDAVIDALKAANQDSCGGCVHATFVASFTGDIASSPDGQKIVRRVWFAVLGKCRLGIALTPKTQWDHEREAWRPFGLLLPAVCEGQAQFPDAD